MARTNLNVGTLVANAGTSFPGTAFDGVNGINIPAFGLTRNLVFRVLGTSGTAGSVLVGPGVYPPAFTAVGTAGGSVSPGGTTIVPVGANSEAWFAVESAKVVQADGSINIDFLPTTLAGTIYAYRLPYNI